MKLPTLTKQTTDFSTTNPTGHIEPNFTRGDALSSLCTKEMNSVTLSEVEQKYMPVNDTLIERTEISMMDEEDVYLAQDM